MSKADVITWQRAMKAAGFYGGLLDGDFGPGTRRASFEASNLRESREEPNTSGRAALTMINGKAVRNRPITKNLSDKLIAAVTAVYGPNSKVAVYSGGQPATGLSKGPRKVRTGSVRHNDYGEGGRAADCYIYVDGKKIFGVELAKLGQYWLAVKYGSCGLEMATGGIHLDEWTTPPKGGGLLWTYAYSNAKPWGAKVRAMLEAGRRGRKP